MLKTLLQFSHLSSIYFSDTSIFIQVAVLSGIILLIGVGSLFFINWMKRLGEDYVKWSKTVLQEEYSLEVRVYKRIKRPEVK